jgi:tetratricopeptide (TPR) repeat protein
MQNQEARTSRLDEGASEPILARPRRFWERKITWARRKPATATASSILGLAVLCLLGTWLYFTAKLQVQTEAARQAERVAAANAETTARNGHEASQQRNAALDLLHTYVIKVDQHLKKDDPVTRTLKKELLDKAIPELARLAQSLENATAAEEHTAAAHERLGEIFSVLAQTQRAKEQFEHALRLAKERVAADPQNREPREHLATAWRNLAGVLVKSGDAAGALEAYAKSVELFEGLATRLVDPKVQETRRQLAKSYELLGTHLMPRDATAARQNYADGMKIRQALAETSSFSIESRQDLARSFHNMGDWHLRYGQASDARSAYGQSRELREAVATADKENVQKQMDLAGVYNRLGDVCALRLGELSEARTYFRRYEEIVELRAAADKENADLQVYQWDAARKLGSACILLGELPAGRKYMQHALNYAEALAAADPESALNQIMVVRVCQQMALLEQRELAFEKALTWLERAQTIFRKLDAGGNHQPQPDFVKMNKEVEDGIAFCKAVPSALQDPAATGKQPPEVAARLLVARAAVFARRGENAKAVETAKLLDELSTKDPAALFHKACGYAVCAAAVAPGKKLAQLTVSEQTARTTYSGRAIDKLKQAVAGGYKDLSQIQTNPNLAAIRDLPDFQTLVKGLKKVL